MSKYVRTPPPDSVTLAAAMALPLAAGSRPFPGRDLLIFLASSVIVFTLVFNGLTLPFLIRWFGVKGDGAAERDEIGMRRAAAPMSATARMRISESSMRSMRRCVKGEG